MRPLMSADLDSAVAVVLALPPQDRAVVAQRLLVEADLADRYRKRLGRAHPVYGTGSLLSAASGRPALPQRPYCDAAYCAGLAIVLVAIQGWRERSGGHSEG